MGRIDNEKRVVTAMITLYCGKHHSGAPCASCAELTAYAMRRLESCRYGARKPKCKNCPTHCYTAPRRAEIRAIMREIGPLMLLKMPIRTIRYLLRS